MRDVSQLDPFSNELNWKALEHLRHRVRDQLSKVLRDQLQVQIFFPLRQQVKERFDNPLWSQLVKDGIL